jgi:ketol-acid reductoisomerase
MGWGQLAAEEIASTRSDMATVSAAADAINTAINNARQWLDKRTWDGQAADSWMGDWNAQFGRLQSLLGQLPAAEAQVIQKITSDAEQMVRREAQAQAKAAQAASG